MAIVRIAVGWGAVVALLLAGPLLEPPVPAWLLITALVLIVGVILVCAFGVVHEAEHLAQRLGDPYGSLVLTCRSCSSRLCSFLRSCSGPASTPPSPGIP